MRAFMQKGIAIGKPVPTGMPIKVAIFETDQEDDADKGWSSRPDGKFHGG